MKFFITFFILAIVGTGTYAEYTIEIHAFEAWITGGTLKPLIPEKSERICEPGTTFNDHCNTCRCSADGKSKSCTMMYCNYRIWNKDGTHKLQNIEPTKSDSNAFYCQPNTKFEQYCDRCECSSDGKSADCTIIDGCDPNIWKEDGTLKFGLIPGQICKPGSAYNDRCNGCTCSDDGKDAVCTKIGCFDTWTRFGRFPVHLNNP